MCLLVDIIQALIKISFEEHEINLLYSVILQGYIGSGGLKNTGMNLKNIKYRNLFFFLEKLVRGGVSSVMEDRYVCEKYMKILDIDTSSLHGWSMSQPLPFKDIHFTHAVLLKEILETDIEIV